MRSFPIKFITWLSIWVHLEYNLEFTIIKSVSKLKHTLDVHRVKVTSQLSVSWRICVYSGAWCTVVYSRNVVYSTAGHLNTGNVWDNVMTQGWQVTTFWSHTNQCHQLSPVSSQSHMSHSCIAPSFDHNFSSNQSMSSVYPWLHQVVRDIKNLKFHLKLEEVSCETEINPSRHPQTYEAVFWPICVLDVCLLSESWPSCGS